MYIFSCPVRFQTVRQNTYAVAIVTMAILFNVVVPRFKSGECPVPDGFEVLRPRQILAKIVSTFKASLRASMEEDK